MGIPTTDDDRNQSDPAHDAPTLGAPPENLSRVATARLVIEADRARRRIGAYRLVRRVAEGGMARS